MLSLLQRSCGRPVATAAAAMVGSSSSALASIVKTRQRLTASGRHFAGAHSTTPDMSIPAVGEGVVCTKLRSPVQRGRDVFVAGNATVIGAVTLKDESSIWYGTVVRGDIQDIVVGVGSNVQDNSVIHTTSQLPTIIGDYVTVGHNAILHACTIGDYSLVGMGAVVMDGADIGERCIVAAGSVVPMHKSFPKHSLIKGSPAKAVRELTDDELEFLTKSAAKYVRVAAEHRAFQTETAAQSAAQAAAAGGTVNAQHVAPISVSVAGYE